MGMICDCEPFEVCPSCAPPWRGEEIVNSKDRTLVVPLSSGYGNTGFKVVPNPDYKPCQHNHAANYDPALVVAGKPVEVLSGGQLKCFDCGEVIAPSVEVPRRYTLAQVQKLMQEWLQIPNGPVDYSPALTMSTFLAWLSKREKELRR